MPAEVAETNIPRQGPHERAALQLNVFNRYTLAASGVLAFLVDLFIVSNYNVQTSLELLRYSGILSTLEGSLLNVGTIAAPLVGMASLILLLFALSNKTLAWQLVGIILFCLVVSLALTPRVLLEPFSSTASQTEWILADIVTAIAAVLAPILMWRSQWLDGEVAKTKWKRVTRVWWSLIVVPVASLAALLLASLVGIGINTWHFSRSDVSVLDRTLGRVWLPTERLEIQNGGTNAIVTGYVLDVDSSGQWTTILLERDRTILIVQSGSIKSRSVCSLTPNSQNDRPIWTVRSSTRSNGTTPLCPGITSRSN
jgi:hypothetical protein